MVQCSNPRLPPCGVVRAWYRPPHPQLSKDRWKITSSPLTGCDDDPLSRVVCVSA